jgi:glycosyltransferase involved in cell wall biosynthesis
MSVPSISIVVPLYNKAPFVARCVASIRAQTFADFEVLVVDDGSTDSSYDDFRRESAHDPRFRVLRQANGGVSRARNAGIEQARSALVAFLDADDEWHPGYLDAIVASSRRHPDAVMVGTAFEILMHDQTRHLRQGAFDGASRIDSTAFFDAWARRGGCPLFIGATAIRRDALRAIGGFEPGMNLGEELLAFVRLTEHGPLAFDDRPLAVYHLSASGSLATSPSLEAIRNHRKLLDELARQARLGRCPKSIYRKWLGIHAEYLIQTGQRVELLRLLAGSPGDIRPRQWGAAMLEAAGLRTLVRRVLGRA